MKRLVDLCTVEPQNDPNGEEPRDSSRHAEPEPDRGFVGYNARNEIEDSYEHQPSKLLPEMGGPNFKPPPIRDLLLGSPQYDLVWTKVMISKEL